MMPHRSTGFLLAALALNFCFGLLAPAGQTTVFVLSLDGWRHDYTERSQTPFINTLIETGAYSHEVVPQFPSVTFQSHVSIATGASSRSHGITGNTFYDSRTQQIFRYAGSASLLEAEPIWTTATRQGVRTLVLDWVNAHQQSGPHSSAYFLDGYTRGINDAERIDRVLQTWQSDTDPTPLRLILAYGESPDKEGHRFGPDAPEIETRVAELDHSLRDIHTTALALWEKHKNPGDSFYFILLSDHGMSRVDALVDLVAAAGLDPDDGVVHITTGTVGHLFFDQIENPERRQQAIQKALSNLHQQSFLKAYPRDQLPASWQYDHPYRTGDLVVELANHHAFRSGLGTPIRALRADDTYRGTHGYDPAKNRDMHTVLYIQRHPDPIGGIDLGPVSLLQIHATIARLLGIDPAPTARPDSIEWQAP